jgi:3-oxoacyl-[acyl-carrier protein] reductase
MLQGWGVVITGAGSGMGAEAARRFAREGARVVVSDIDGAAANAVALEIAAPGERSDASRAIGVRCDVASAEDCAQLVAAAEDFFGAPIDVFLANAGVSFAGDFLSADPQALKRIVDVNVTGSIFSAQAALRSLVKSPHASLIFTSSISGVTARARRSVYNASKHALGGLVKSLALEFGPSGVRVNAIAPGSTDTAFLRTHLAKVEDDVDAAVARIVSAMPTGRLVSTGDFADAAVFLASPGAKSITGHTLLLDGGAAAGKM